MEDINPITRLTGVTYSDLARWTHELNAEINSIDFRSKPFAYRSNVQRFRVALDQLAAAMRGIDESDVYSYYGAHRANKIYRDPRKEASHA